MVMVLVSTVADAAIAPAMISAWTSRLWARASIRPARNCDRYRMLATSAIRPARFSETMRRVRLEKLSAKKNCPARRSQPNGRCHPGARLALPALGSGTRAGRAPADSGLRSSCVRSSNGQNRPVVSTRSLEGPASLHLTPDAHGRQRPKPRGVRLTSGFLEAITHAIEGFDHLEIVIHDLEFLAQPLDVAVDGAVIDIDLIVISRIHQGVAAFYHAGTGGQGLQDQKFGHRQRDRLVLPGAGMTFRVHPQ